MRRVCTTAWARHRRPLPDISADDPSEFHRRISADSSDPSPAVFSVA